MADSFYDYIEDDVISPTPLLLNEIALYDTGQLLNIANSLNAIPVLNAVRYLNR